jgi:hypothetical protein
VKLPRYTLVHSARAASGPSSPPPPAAAPAGAALRTFVRLTVAEFERALSAFAFTRKVNAVHLHHTWRPNHAQYRGHASIVAMWRFHVERNGWSDIAQHVTIGPEGAIWTGRDWNVAPASAAGHNGNAAFGPFMIEMVGDFDRGCDAWGGEQRAAALAVVAAVLRRFSLPPQALHFHSQMSAKTCPGTSIDYEEVVRELEPLRASALSVAEGSGAGLAEATTAEPPATTRAPALAPQFWTDPARREDGDAEPSESGDSADTGGDLPAASPAAERSTRGLLGAPALAAAPATDARGLLGSAPPALVGAFLPAAAADGVATSGPRHQGGAPLRGRARGKAVRPPARALQVGLWDLDAYVGGLPRVIAALNAAQQTYAFYECLAAMPAGIVSEPRRLRSWSRERTGSSRLASVERNIVAGDFFDRAERVRRDVGLDYLAGVTASMIADEDDEQVYYNLFSTSCGRLLLASTWDLRKYASKAGRTFEAAVLGVTIAQLLVARHRRVEFHDDRGCLFDSNFKRSTIVRVLREPKVEERCLSLIPAGERPAVQALVSALGAYGGGGSQ